VNYRILICLSLLLSVFEMRGQLAINEFNSQRGFTDERGKNVDWVEVYNHSSSPVNLGGYCLSDNPNNLDKWRFPAVELAPQSMITICASGRDEVRFPARWESLVRADNVWKYWNGSAPPANYASWKELGYNDQTWASGAGGIGYGDNDDQTTIATTPSILLRYEFVVHDVEEITHLIFHADYDDGFVAYLNGQEIMRSDNLSASPAYHELTSSLHEAVMYSGGIPDDVMIDGEEIEELLQDGANILAIRVHNASANSSDLTGNFFLSAGLTSAQDQYQNIPAWFIPPVVLPHASFKLATGETIVISDTNEVVIDSIAVPEGLSPNISRGRTPDGTGNWCFFDSPTPDASNNQSACYSSITPAPIVDLPSGWYSSSNPISVTTAANGTSHYTTNGDEPDQNDPVVNGLIYVSQTSVLSVKSFGNNGQSLPSPNIDRTYIIDEDNHNLPVISIITDEDHLWDWNTGIYVLGPNASSNYPYFGSNFWQPWSRKSRMEFFDRNQNKQFEAVVDLEIHGGYSRAEPQKSFRIDAKSIYTGDVEYPLIERKPEITTFNNFNLRNGGQHGIFNRIQDAVFSRLADGTHIDRMGYQATLVYLNGEFWGLYGIREKFDEHYVESNHGVDKDEVQLLNRDGALVGDASHFNESYNIITNQSANSQNFVEVFSSRFDLNNYLDYFIFQTYIQNRDWMGIDWGINNVKLWRQDTVGATWRYMMYDTDFGFALYGGSIYHNYINRARNPDYPNQHSQIFNHALNNADFRCQFVNRYDDLINTTFQTDVFDAVVDELKTELAPAIPDHIAQWSNQMGPYSYTYWLNSVNGLKTYNSTRIPTARQHINQSFNLQGQKLVELAASPTNTGHIKINSIQPPLPWDGIYHGGCPITTEAIPSFGYLFSHWTSDDTNYQNAQDATIQVALSDNTTLTAHFQPCEAVISASILESGNQLRPQVSEEVEIYAYEWRLNGALVSEDSVLYNPVDGDYTLMVRFDSCQISSEALGIYRGDYELLLFPNPAVDVLRIQFVLGEEEPLELALFNTLGELVWKESHTDFMGQFNSTIDISTLAKGTYILRAATPSLSYSGKVMKVD